MKSKYLLIIFPAIFIFTSCASNISNDTYTMRQVGETSVTYSGTVKSVRMVQVQAGGDNSVGALGGGAAGGMLGNAVGGGVFSTVVGSFAGAVTGAAIQKSSKNQMAYEYVIALENGSLMTIIQGQENPFEVEQPVYLITSQNGRSRIVPR
ncbi:Outer membrane lipoprotein SlyB precursor [Candidatus Rubidus massiliensis]|nr:Outer membrane lipoprotein SlyB precursor [Candidatus Rubidus massiliensis]